MEVQEGFIVGIFNYCDRWCERCPLTNRCRVFATISELDFERGNGPLTEPWTVRERRRMRDTLVEMHAQFEEATEDDLPKPGERVGHLPADMEMSTGRPDPEVIANSPALQRKFHEISLSNNAAVRSAMATIKYFAVFVPMKMARTLSQVEIDGPGDVQSDANGSGKAALLGLEEMEQAWRLLIATHHVSAAMAAPFLAEIARMQRNVLRAVPNARAFVRPGFDELDAVKMLDAEDRMH